MLITKEESKYDKILYCPWCKKEVKKEPTQYYSEILYECNNCGTILNEIGKDKTSEYYYDVYHDRVKKKGVK